MSSGRGVLVVCDRKGPHCAVAIVGVNLRTARAEARAQGWVWQRAPAMDLCGPCASGGPAKTVTGVIVLAANPEAARAAAVRHRLVQASWTYVDHPNHLVGRRAARVIFAPGWREHRLSAELERFVGYIEQTTILEGP